MKKFIVSATLASALAAASLHAQIILPPGGVNPFSDGDTIDSSGSGNFSYSGSLRGGGTINFKGLNNLTFTGGFESTTANGTIYNSIGGGKELTFTDTLFRLAANSALYIQGGGTTVIGPDVQVTRASGTHRLVVEDYSTLVFNGSFVGGNNSSTAQAASGIKLYDGSNATLKGSGTISGTVAIGTTAILHSQNLKFSGLLTFQHTATSTGGASNSIAGNRTARFGLNEKITMLDGSGLSWANQTPKVRIDLDGEWKFSLQYATLLFDFSDNTAILNTAFASVNRLLSNTTFTYNDASLVGVVDENTGLAMTLNGDFRLVWAGTQADKDSVATTNGVTLLVLGSEEANALGIFERGVWLIGAQAIPEPSTWLLLGAGLAFAALVRRKRK